MKYVYFVTRGITLKYFNANASSKTVQGINFQVLGYGFSPFAVVLKFGLESKSYSHNLF